VSREFSTMCQWACLLCGSAVALGAFGAHGLKSRLTPEMLAVFEVGVRYQFYHGLALLALGLGVGVLSGSNWLRYAGRCWILGTVVFSGSLYLLALTDIRWLGAITPIGGVAFILGWLFAALAVRSAAVSGDDNRTHS
jgi:uncharacterized membrane protein YgdD (TMEM256/DUF423 family)